MDNESPPGILYHYTSNRGLVGILQNRRLWFSDPRFLNDAAEIKHAAMLRSNKVNCWSEQFREKYLENGVGDKLFDDWIKNLTTYFEDTKIKLYDRQGTQSGIQLFQFIFSLSEKKDDLNQWRAYGNGEYCIGFNAEVLRQIRGARLIKVQYPDDNNEDDIQNKRVDDLVRGFFETHLRYRGPRDPEVFYDSYNDLNSQFPRENYLKYKNYNFKDEEEWRLVLNVFINSNQEYFKIYPPDNRIILPHADFELFFDDTGTYPAPRIKANIERELASGLFNKIICGPGLDDHRVRFALGMMSENYGVPVCRSKVPYRSAKEV